MRLVALFLCALLLVTGAAGNRKSVAVSVMDRARLALAKTSGELQLAGLKQPVEVFRDPWGVPHIFAKNTDDLFFAQGFVAAQDRLWQMEMWRRAGRGHPVRSIGTLSD